MGPFKVPPNEPFNGHEVPFRQVCVFRPKPATDSEGIRPLFRVRSESVADIPRKPGRGDSPAGRLPESLATQVLLNLGYRVPSILWGRDRCQRSE
jgi:hypothetical protein